MIKDSEKLTKRNKSRIAKFLFCQSGPWTPISWKFICISQNVTESTEEFICEELVISFGHRGSKGLYRLIERDRERQREEREERRKRLDTWAARYKAQSLAKLKSFPSQNGHQVRER